MKTAVIDTDFILHAVACAGEERSVKVIHKESGRELIVPNKTAWYGAWQRKDGGMLAEINKQKDKDWKWDDFDYIDIQEPEPLSNVLHSAKTMFESVVKKSGCDRYKAFIGNGETFRNERATILEYKGNRKELTKPLHLEEVKAYLIKKFNIEVVDHIECDDACIIEAYKKKDHIVVAVDKDTGGNAVQWFNPNNPEDGVVDCDQFGKLWLNDKGDVKGIGRLFFYYQCTYGDDVDNYRANSASDKRWGSKSAYKAMVHCKNDKEALQSLVDVYKTLYPEPKIITGWRGEEIEIDWLSVASENWELARMLRTMDELENRIILKDVLDKVGIQI